MKRKRKAAHNRKGIAGMATSPQKPFLSDVETLRDRARKSLSQGAVTPAYQGDVKKTIEILQTVLATEIVCVLRYTQHSIAAAGISSEGIKKGLSHSASFGGPSS